MSDYYGIPQMESLHKVAADKAEAARMALEAGVDIELPDPDAYTTIPQLVREGRVSMATVDRAVARNLRAKFLLGLFENPYVDPDRAERVTDSEAHRALAAEAARRSITLLKNQGNLLPLDRTKLASIAVIGPNANRAHLGGYSDDPQRGISVLQGITDKVGASIRVKYAEGVKITKEGGNWWADTSTPSDPAEDTRLIAEAVNVAKTSDVVLLVIGGNEDTNKEAWADNHLGDRDSVELFGRQEDLVRAIVATGKPVAVMLINGGPLATPYVAEKVPAILEGFYLGQETGVAVADVLFGDYNPSGKLPISFPRSTGQLPIYYNHKPTAKRGYLFASKEALFPFGHGLSYTTFGYSAPALGQARIGVAGQTTVSVTVTNTGRVRGEGGRAALHPRPGELGDAAGEGAEGLPAGVARAGREQDGELRDHAGDALVPEPGDEAGGRAGNVRHHDRQKLGEHAVGRARGDGPVGRTASVSSRTPKGSTDGAYRPRHPWIFFRSGATWFPGLRPARRTAVSPRGRAPSS